MKCMILLLAAGASALPLWNPFASLLGQRDAGSDLVAITDQYSFSTTLADFVKKRTAKDPPQLDWSSDGCSKSPDNPLGFPFEPACQRHDFGYRNNKAQGRFDANKAKLDTQFKTDLEQQCQTVEKKVLRGACKALAEVYYEAVKNFGNLKEKRKALAEAEGAEDANMAAQEAGGDGPTKELDAAMAKYQLAERAAREEMPASAGGTE